MKRIFCFIACALILTMTLVGCSSQKTDQEVLESVASEANGLSDEQIHEQYKAAHDNMSNIYYNILEEAKADDGPLKGDGLEYGYGLFVRAYLAVRAVMPFVMAISFFIGIIVAAINWNKNRKAVKFAIIWLCILIPIGGYLIIQAIGWSPLFART